MSCERWRRRRRRRRSRSISLLLRLSTTRPSRCRRRRTRVCRWRCRSAVSATQVSGSIHMTSGTGNCVITASQEGNDNYLAATDVVRTVAASKKAQAITFDQPASPAVYDSTFTVSPTANSGLSVAVSVSGVCEQVGGSIHMTSGTGNCVITASQEGNDNYLAATDVVRTVAASKKAQAITFDQPASPAVYDSTFTVSPTANSGLSVAVSVSGVCEQVSGSIHMTSGTGNCVITASQEGTTTTWRPPMSCERWRRRRRRRRSRSISLLLRLSTTRPSRCRRRRTRVCGGGVGQRCL